jgi:hypothetical protein
MVEARVRRNRRHLVWPRRTGAAGTPSRLPILRIVAAPPR